MKTIEGWEAWDLFIRLLPQIREKFPLSEAFEIGEALGYKKLGLAEFLPTICMTVSNNLIKHIES